MYQNTLAALEELMRSPDPLAAMEAYFEGEERKGKGGGLLQRGTKGREGRREGAERERCGIPPPNVNVSRIDTGCIAQLAGSLWVHYPRSPRKDARRFPRSPRNL